jgi:hypothetical protein
MRRVPNDMVIQETRSVANCGVFYGMSGQRGNRQNLDVGPKSARTISACFLDSTETGIALTP